MLKQQLIEAFVQAAESARAAGTVAFDTLPTFAIERPANPAHGDFSSNLAMTLASQARQSPRRVAEALVTHLQLASGLLDHVEIAGPGFINVYLKRSWLGDVVRDVYTQGAKWGCSTQGAGHKVLVEFVSANPNGPLSIPHGRGAIIGDVLCNVLTAAGYGVSREFYVNDAATSMQMTRFGESLAVRYLQAFGQDVEFPEDGYHGEYVTEFAQSIAKRDGDKYVSLSPDERRDTFTAMGIDVMLDWQRDVLASFGVEFDHWFRESALLAEGAVDAALAALEAQGVTYQADGAVWLASTRYGDDKDRPLVRTNGKPTYLASDVAYHKNKFDRGFDTLVDIWGPDHHGYVARTRASVAALGYAPERLRILIYQVVKLLRDGEFVMGGKRKGDIVLLSELIAQVGRDAARFFFLLRSADTELNFDLDLAVKQSPDNPVYYVQYAHSRIASILRTAEERGIAVPDAASVNLDMLGSDEAEAGLVRRIGEFPEEVAAAASFYEPHRLARYAQELARDFHVFYDRCPVLRDDVAEDVRHARLILVGAAQITLRNVLGMLGVSAPERM
jgi:arginyl-tRNA synthetase